jgi:hypothetical protein
MTESNPETSPDRTAKDNLSADPAMGSPEPPRGPESAESSPVAATADDESTSGSPAASRPEAGEGRLRTSDLVQRGEQDAGTPAPADSQDDKEVAGPPLVSDADGYLSRWQAIQVAFVDEPKRAVQDADSLVAEVMQRLAESFATERDRLEQQWSGGQDAGTEELRLALQRYRSFFNRLLST